MAMFKRDAQSKLVWHQLADRWTRCAEWAERESIAAQNAQLQRQKRRRDKPRRAGREDRPDCEELLQAGAARPGSRCWTSRIASRRMPSTAFERKQTRVPLLSVALPRRRTA
jgi:hypothetical protein